MGTGGNNVPMVMEPLRSGFNWDGSDIYETLAATSEVKGCYMLDKGKVTAVIQNCFQCTGFGYWQNREVGATLRTGVGGDANKDNLVCCDYIVRRLTPTECMRLQGLPDDWKDIPHYDDFSDEQYLFWLDVRNTHERVNGKTEKHYTKDQMLKWYNKLQTDSAMYKMAGNGIALPNALYVFEGIAEVLERTNT